MTRKEATNIIYKVINSGIIDTELEDELTIVCNNICNDEFEKCEIDERCKHGLPNYCEGCKFINE